MIDEIFTMIMKEARKRPGKDMVKKIATVSMEISERIMAAMEGIRQQQKKEDSDED